ncbi:MULTISPECIES: glutamate racemase [Clostridium]|uniref:Glutamate racemase n=1 Tax=Clostridium cibarium TaxID=2762247 RepID=A0ABR8PRV9_9CLOT|nr:MULTISPECIES: glutamate racemase [Clostridium]MBD7910882.1 glutamate racemase [Clostridium cibarium]
MPIGFFDSGVGGLSVLREAIKLLPNEHFIYFGDSKNAPYGVKKVEEVRELTHKAVEFLIDKGAKAIVIACNTATSAAISTLRETYTSMPVIGIEPALKPAVKLHRDGAVVIMATPVTLQEKKFINLMEKYKDESEIVSMPCPGLVEFIEKGNIDGEEVRQYLEEKFKIYKNIEIGSIVLGCTHYPFVKNLIKDILGYDVPIIDGGFGTSKELKRKLEELKVLSGSEEKGDVKIYNSLEGDNIIKISNKLLYS